MCYSRCLLVLLVITPILWAEKPNDTEFARRTAQAHKAYNSIERLSPETLDRIRVIRSKIAQITQNSREEIIKLTRMTNDADEGAEFEKKAKEIEINAEIEIIKLRREIAVLLGDKKEIEEADHALEQLTRTEKKKTLRITDEKVSVDQPIKRGGTSK